MEKNKSLLPLRISVSKGDLLSVCVWWKNHIALLKDLRTYPDSCLIFPLSFMFLKIVNLILFPEFLFIDWKRNTNFPIFSALRRLFS